MPVHPSSTRTVTPQAETGFASNVKLRLLPVIAEGWLTVTDPLHLNSPAQKYRTTPEGLAAVHDGDGEVPAAITQTGLEF